MGEKAGPFWYELYARMDLPTMEAFIKDNLNNFKEKERKGNYLFSFKH